LVPRRNTLEFWSRVITIGLRTQRSHYEQGLSLPGFIKDLRCVAAFQNPQQAMYSLRETVLKNSMAKQNQQALGALAIGGLVILALAGMSKG
jgi:hypothetical protein